MGVYGMSYNEYWHGDPWLAYYYKQAYIERRKAENERDWLQGAYFYNAVSAALANGFKQKGSKRVNYIEEPFRIFPMTKEERAEEDRKAREQAMKALKAMQAKQHKKLQKQQEKRNAETSNSGTGNRTEVEGID